ncbi:DUF4214 domain-containing protein [Pseudomonas sp. CFBP 13719]|uniref:DUF4214 domain-containing protein n=1 Tax=Pseudomonas sp. CFBP 13719 TaxID=2775303 RepID=UPI0017802784|nr:DUF4214 domain-containing protein [Pseudomonas sp. CFBP 13719]MBD8684817.1 DUF4214 domain-containing protein [Pseudomonas sp. CFBP 13719]
MQYDSPISSESFQTTLTGTNFSSATAAAISTLLSLETTDTVNLASWDGVSAPLTPTGQTAAAEVVTGTIAGRTGDTVNLAIPDSLASAKAFVLDSNANLNVTFNPVAVAPAAPAALAEEVSTLRIAAAAIAADPATAIEFLVKTGNGDDIITVTGDQNTYIDAGFGNDIITTGNGNNTVVAGLGNNVITTGTGNDTIVLSGVNHSDVVNTGAGYDVVRLDGSSSDYTFVTGNNYNVTLNGTQGLGQTAAITNAEFLIFTDSEGAGSTVALAHNEAEAAALRLYDGILGRDADVGGAKQWTTQINEGTSLSTIAQNFLNSAEYTDGDNTAFIDTLYGALLGRSVVEDTAGAQNWLSVLAKGGSLVDVVTGIATSQEAIAKDSTNGAFVQSLYSAALDREADTDGLSSWIGQLVNGASRAEVAAGILGSSEAAEKSTDNFLNDLYIKALGRTEDQAAADVAGKAGWAEALANGATQADVAIGIIGSQEAIAHIDNVVVLHGAV